MEHNKLKAPALPGHTPFLPNSRISPTDIYGGKTQTHHTGDLTKLKITKVNSPVNETYLTSLIERDAAIAIDSNNLTKPEVAHEQAYIQKMVVKLPPNLRESVMSIVNVSMNNNANSKAIIDSIRKDLKQLRDDLKKKTDEADGSAKTCSVYRERVKTLENTVNSLKDTISQRDSVAVRTRGVVSRLSATNRMLIDTIDALDKSVLKEDKSKPMDMPAGRSNLLLPISSNVKPDPPSPKTQLHKSLQMLQNSNQTKAEGNKFGSMFYGATAGSVNYGTHEEEEVVDNKDHPGIAVVTVGGTDKLRESLLRLAREHLKSLKASEVMEKEISDLRDNIKTIERNNKQLKVEIEDLKLERGIDPVGEGDKSSDNSYIVNTTRFYGKVDERFKVLMNRHSIDSTDALIKFRRIVSFMVNAPSSMQFNDVIEYFTSREAHKLFEVELICVFIKQKKSDIMNKYTSRSSLPQAIDVAQTKSIAGDVIKHCKVGRFNSLQRVMHFRPEIDGCSGVIVKKLLSVPLSVTADDNEHAGGCIQLLNRFGPTGFSEVDELFMLVIADFLDSLLKSCENYKLVVDKEDLFKCILAIPDKLYKLGPTKLSIGARPLQFQEILSVLEDVACGTLKCAKVRAFLNCKYCSNTLGSGYMLAFEEDINLDSSVSKSLPSSVPLRQISVESGVAGYVIARGFLYVAEVEDIRVNPSVDIESVGSTMIAIPILGANQEVLGCVEMILGIMSPPLRLEEGDTNRVTFTEAALMIAKQFASPLKYLLDSCKVDNKDSVAATSDTAILKQELDSNISLINELRASLSQAHDEYTALNKKTISLQNSLTEMGKKQSSNTYLEQLEEAKGHNLEYKNRIAALEAKLAVKETTIATLTQQIEKMANDNLMKLVQENTSSPWRECVDENGNVYYYNSETNESSWEKP
jgi:hypothetical protein